MNKLLYIIYVCSNVVDYGLTVWGITLTSFEVEFNPIARDILVNNGISGLFVYKFGGMVFVLLLLAILFRVNWSEPWVKHMAPVLLLLGIVVSLIGVWSWLPHIIKYV